MGSDSASVKTAAFGDLERELSVTRTVLERLPAEHYGWKPHEKSMTLGKLGIHVADLPRWAKDALARDVLDFKEVPMPPASVKDSAELVAYFDANVKALREAVAGFDIARLNGMWTMRDGDQVFTTQLRWKVFRIWSVNHLVHHRAQLCLYLRLLNVPVPTVYFNTADDPAWVFE